MRLPNTIAEHVRREIREHQSECRFARSNPRFMEDFEMTMRWGAAGNNEVKNLAVMMRIDPQDDDAIQKMMLGLVRAETGRILDSIPKPASQPAETAGKP